MIPLVTALLLAATPRPPTYLPAAGTYSTTMSVSVRTTTPGTAIYCTTDGTTPTRKATLRVTGTLTIAATTTLKCIASTPLARSKVTTGAYIINIAPATVPTLAVVADNTTVDASIIPQGYLDEIRKLDILFQHKSVGDNITKGIQAMGDTEYLTTHYPEYNPYRYALTQLGWNHGANYLGSGWTANTPAAAWFDTNSYRGTAGTMASSENGHSGCATSKTMSFNQTMRGQPITYQGICGWEPPTGNYNDSYVSGEYGAHVDVAMLKFCFEEIWDPSGNGTTIFNTYRTMMEGLIHDYPDVKFVWFTMPPAYVAGQNPGAPYGHPSKEFNDSLRAYIATNGGYLFDVADIESKCTNGTTATDAFGYPAVCLEFAGTPTDPHPGAEGTRRLAHAWWWLMARVVGWDGANAPGGGGVAYHVGAGQAYTTIGAVPWSTLAPGATVYIHPGTYNEKILVSTSGTPTQWIRVIGVPDASGNLPIIEGAGAFTPPSQQWRTAPHGSGGADVVESTSLVGVMGTAVNGVAPSYVEIANLEIRNAFLGNTFYSAYDGTAWAYDNFASCINIHGAKHILIRDNKIHDCGQGVYVWTFSGSGIHYWDVLSEDIIIRRNWIYGNGDVSNDHSHQTYTEADGTIIEGNRFGVMRPGALGSQLKDRSAGTVVRYNYFEQAANSAYILDLVDPQEGGPRLFYTYGNPVVPNIKYTQAWVYGNTLRRSNTAVNLVHWSEDQYAYVGREMEPNGRLFFYNNTIIDTGGNDTLWNQHIGGWTCPNVDMPGRVVFQNNVVYSSRATWILGEYCAPRDAYSKGLWDFGANWLKVGYTLQLDESTGTGAIIVGADPAFVSTVDPHPAAGSPLLGVGAALDPAITSTTNTTGKAQTPTKQYGYPHTTPTPVMINRRRSGVGSDLGAFER